MKYGNEVLEQDELGVGEKVFTTHNIGFCIEKI